MIDSCITCHVLAQIFSSCIFVYLYRNNRKVRCPIKGFVDMSHTEHYVTFLCTCQDVRPPDKSVFSFLSTKTYVVGTQKNRLNETVLRVFFEDPKYMYKIDG